MSNNFISLENLSSFLENVKTLINQKSDKQQIIASTLTSSKWSSGSYSFEATYPVASFDLEVALNSTCTEAQLEAWNNALIVGSATTNVLKAFGTVPTVNIPIIIKVVKK